nr:retrovirus-related Pol polyprotein from transposon TNT 1-94 [Tanacetum cinerariifolium]
MITVGSLGCFSWPLRMRLVPFLQNSDGDAVFDGKEANFDTKKPESEVIVSPSSSAQSIKQDDNTKKEAKGKSPVESFIGYRDLSVEFEDYFDNSINRVNAAELEDITYSNNVGVEADFNNLETSITANHIQTTRVYNDHPDEKGIVVRNTARLVAQGHTQKEGIDYEEVFAPVARIKAIRLFLAYASFMGFMVYQMNVKSAFLYGTIEEEVYVCQPPEFEDPDHLDKVYKVVNALYEGKSASTPIDTEKPLLKDPDGEDVDVHTYRSMIGSLMYLTSSRPDIMFAAEYVAAANCCAQVLWIQNQLLDYRLQALVDKKKVVVTKATIREALRLDDEEGVECLPNKEFFTELARMGYEKPSTKLTFYKAFFSCQWNLVRNVDSPSKFYMYPCFLQLMIRKQVVDLSTHTTKYTSPALTQKVFANIRRVGKGFSRVETPLFESMLVEQQVDEEGDADENVEEVNDGDVAEGDVSAAHGEVPTVAEEPSIPYPTPPTPPPQPSQDIPLTSQVQPTPPQSPQERMIAKVDADVDVVLEGVKEAADEAKEVAEDAKVDESVDIQGRQAESQAEIYKIDLDHANKVLSTQEDETEPTEVQEVVDDVTTTKLITKVVTASSETITAASTNITAAKAQVPAVTLIAAPSKRRKGVVIKDPKEESTTSIIIPAETKFKNKGKGILVEELKPLKKKQQIELDEQYARELHAELNKDIDWDEVIDHVKIKAKEDRALTKEQIKEDENRALKRLNETLAERAAKRRKLDEEVEELKINLQIVPNEEDDVYTEATPLARKVPIVDYQIIKMNNKPYYKIIRADDTQQMYIITFTTTQLILLVERKYPLIRFTLDQMLNAVRLKVKEESEVSLELLRFTRQ